MDPLEIARAGQAQATIGWSLPRFQRNTQHPNHITSVLPGLTADMAEVMDQTDHPHHRGRMDRQHGAIGHPGLVVEGDIAAGHWGIQGRASG